MLYYDYMLTLKDEIAFIWNRKSGSVTVLYFLNRYISLAGNIPVLLKYFASWSSKVRIDLISHIDTYSERDTSRGKRMHRF